MIAIGIDIGGTTSRVAAVDLGKPGSRLPSVVSSRISATPTDSSGDALIGWIAQSIREIQTQLSIDRVFIGLALPGPVDRDRGLLVRSVNLPFLESRPIVRDLQQRTCQHVTLWTDAEAATWGEYIAIKPVPQSFVHLRFGTGVACGIIIDGQFVYPERTNSGHLDVLVVDHSSSASLCPCGKRGCLETVASGATLVANGQTLTSLQQAYDTGIPNGMRQVQSVASAIHAGIVNLVREFHSKTIVVGGGVIEHLPALFLEVCNTLRSVPFPFELVAPTILPPKLGDLAGVIGAALLARSALGNG